MSWNKDQKPLTQWLAEVKSPDHAVCSAALHHLFDFLHGELQALALHYIHKCAGSQNDLERDEIIADLLVRLERLGFPPTDSEHLRRYCCRALYNMVLNDWFRRLTELGSAQNEIRDSNSSPRPFAVDRNENARKLYDALVRLERAHPDWANAFKARLYFDHQIRFSATGLSLGTVAHAAGNFPEGEGRIWAEVANVLGLAEWKVRENYNKARQWLRQQFPDFTPEDFVE